MKKTINITIGGIVFNLEEDGYQKLNNYLDSLKNHFAQLSYGAEVIADIESRIAEQFTARTSGKANQAVTDLEVEEIIRSIGKVEDFAEPNTNAKHASEPETPSSGKKLYRNPDDKVVAGVASGLAAYFGWDVTWVRVLFAIIILAGGWGVTVYFILWLVMPEAKTASQKLEMRGEPVNIQQMEQAAKEKINEKISEIKGTGGFQKIAQLIGKIIVFLVRVILFIIGLSLAFASAVATFAVTFTAASLLFAPDSVYINSSTVASVFAGTEYFLAVILGFITALVPLIFLGLAGTSLIRRKPTINGTLAASLAVVWLVAAVGVSVLAVNKAPAIESAINEYRGQVETRAIQAENFTKTDISSGYQVNISYAKDYSVKLVGHTEDLDNSKVSFDNGTLTVGRRDKFKICLICFGDEVTVNVTTPDLDRIRGSGSVDYHVTNFTVKDLEVELLGASQIDVDITASNLTVDLSGASEASLSGTSQSLKSKLSGSSELTAFDLSANDVIIHASGASYAEITAAKNLDAKATGASDIIYRGNPKITNQDESGSSSIRPE